MVTAVPAGMVAGLMEVSVGGPGGVMRIMAALENASPPADTSISAVPTEAIHDAGTVAVN
jgi:hypothetical protein